MCAIHVGCFSARLQRGFRPGDHRSGIVEVFIQKATVGCNIGRLRWDVTAGGGSGKPQSELPFSEIGKLHPERYNGRLRWEATVGGQERCIAVFRAGRIHLWCYNGKLRWKLQWETVIQLGKKRRTWRRHILSVNFNSIDDFQTSRRICATTSFLRI